jgi:hypothetical protein
MARSRYAIVGFVVRLCRADDMTSERVTDGITHVEGGPGKRCALESGLCAV